jgi:hypothetical protein
MAYQKVGTKPKRSLMPPLPSRGKGASWAGSLDTRGGIGRNRRVILRAWLVGAAIVSVVLQGLPARDAGPRVRVRQAVVEAQDPVEYGFEAHADPRIRIEGRSLVAHLTQLAVLGAPLQANADRGGAGVVALALKAREDLVNAVMHWNGYATIWT